eukprot:12805891-Heterocapsa_arctica.AAC.1
MVFPSMKPAALDVDGLDEFRQMLDGFVGQNSLVKSKSGLSLSRVALSRSIPSHALPYYYYYYYYYYY